MLGKLPERDPRLSPILRSGQHELDRSRKLLRAAEEITGED